MLDLRFVRENPDIVKENIKKKFQDNKLALVDEVIALDLELRDIKPQADDLRADRNRISKEIGGLMAQGKKDEAEEMKKKVTEASGKLADLEAKECELQEKIKTIMMTIPNIIDDSVPIGKDDSENVEVECFGEPIVPEFEVPYHTDIMEMFNGIDLDSARKVAGSGFYYLMGDIARLHSAVTSYARDFMINRGFTYCIPPFMIVVCEPKESPMWYDKLWQNTVDFFRTLDIPVRTLECCSGDLADLKVKSVDVEAWSPRQQKYFEVGSCSNLGDAQARRLKIRVNGENGKYFAHTLNNTVVAPPRMLIAFLENNLTAEGAIKIPKALQPYMGGMTEITNK